MSTTNVTQATEEWYREYYRQKSADRNDILRNPEVLFQVLATEASLTQAVRSTGIDPEKACVLDVGCGTGASVLQLMRLGFQTHNIHGIDVHEERIDTAALRIPSVHWQCGDAGAMSYSDGHFDLVLESTMFVQITDDDLTQRIASEMIRVTKPGGHILLVDWRYADPRDKTYKAVSGRRICDLFEAGGQTKVKGVYKGALVPPIGRRLSRYLPALYFPLRALCPFLSGQVTTVLQKVG